jgi:hypothetical protein
VLRVFHLVHLCVQYRQFLSLLGDGVLAFAAEHHLDEYESEVDANKAPSVGTLVVWFV